MIKDYGFIIYDKDTNAYFTGVCWDSALRLAKIYTSDKYARSLIESSFHNNCILMKVEVYIIGEC